MKKILVTTDFSRESKAAIRFAIQLSLKQPVHLTFFHSYFIMKPFAWSKEMFDKYESREYKRLKKQLYLLVQSVYKQQGILPKSLDCVIKSSMVTDSNIADYAETHHYNFICISRSGEGKKASLLFGTNTTNLIEHAQVPVIAIPGNYRSKPIKKILYASDFCDVTPELKTVVSFARFFDAKISMVHLRKLFETDYAIKDFEKDAHQKFNYKIDFSKPDYINNISLAENLSRVAGKLKSSLMVMFTHQDKSFLDKLLFDTNASECAVYATIPLLVFKKSILENKESKSHQKANHMNLLVDNEN